MAFNINLPAWDRTEPELYFEKLDAIFEINNIKDEKKQYAMVITSLGTDAFAVIKALEETAAREPELRPKSMGSLRYEVISRFSKSRLERVKTALTMPSVLETGMRPSRWLCHLESSMSCLKMDDLKWYLLFRNLPAHLWPFLDGKNSAYIAAMKVDHMFTLDGETLMDI